MCGLAAGLGAAAMAVASAGCRGERSDQPPRQFFPDMDDSPKWKPQAQTVFYEDGRTMRPALPGTVSWGNHADPAFNVTFARADLPAEFWTGMDAGGAPVPVIPAAAFGVIAPRAGSAADTVAASIERGQERFNIYCSVCHGYQGNGRGMVGERWSSFPANFHDPKFMDPTLHTGTDGHIFDVIRHGLFDQTGAMKMPPYGHAISEADAWAIVAYVRVLQSSWTTSLDDVPAELRARLEATRPTPPAAAPQPEADSSSMGASPTPANQDPSSNQRRSQPTETPSPVDRGGAPDSQGGHR